VPCYIANNDRKLAMWKNECGIPVAPVAFFVGGHTAGRELHPRTRCQLGQQETPSEDSSPRAFNLHFARADCRGDLSAINSRRLIS
jgi:hypothetical protein